MSIHIEKDHIIVTHLTQYLNYNQFLYSSHPSTPVTIGHLTQVVGADDILYYPGKNNKEVIIILGWQHKD